MEQKKCSRCKVLKPHSEYRKKRLGLESYCKSCEKEYQKEYRKKNAKKIAKYQKEYEKKDPEKTAKWKKEYDKKNTDNLTDLYVTRALGLKAEDCPQSLIQLKRQQLKIIRQLRK